MLHPTKPDWSARWAEVNGPQFDIAAQVQKVPVLPSYFPRIEGRRRVVRYQNLDAVALSLRDTPRLVAMAREQGVTVRELIGLSPEQKVIVLGFEADVFLERAWGGDGRLRLLYAIRDLRPDAAVAWNYSVWHRHSSGWLFPRAEHVYNLKRSLVIYQELQMLGVTAIPHVYWGKLDDLDRWSTWLHANRSVRVIAIDLQTADSSQDFAQVIAAMSHLSHLAPAKLHVLFSGVCGTGRVAQLKGIWPRSSFTNFAPLHCALRPRQRRYGLAAAWTDAPTIDRSAVFNAAIAEYQTLLGDAGSASEVRAVPRVIHADRAPVSAGGVGGV